MVMARCFKACFGSNKGERRRRRIAPGNAATTGLRNHAPPSSPASFSTSIAQSPSALLSLYANSPGGPSSAMFATGPYAHETQLVSPPVYSAFITEPSLTPASSPEVPYARFLTFPANEPYALYPGSPASSLRSPLSGDDVRSSSFPEPDFFSPQWGPLASPKCSRSDSSYPRTPPEANTPPKASEVSNFFCPDTFARYYIDPFSHTGGRLSVSNDSDVVYPSGGNAQRISKQDMEELEEAYRASFGFSADEAVTASQSVETTRVNRDGSLEDASEGERLNSHGFSEDLQKSVNLQEPLELCNDHNVRRSQAKTSRKYRTGLWSSDAEIDY